MITTMLAFAFIFGLVAGVMITQAWHCAEIARLTNLRKADDEEFDNLAGHPHFDRCGDS